MKNYPLPLVGFCAYSGTGKTTLLTQLLPLLKSDGLKVGVIKHAHHNFEIDHSGKDSYQLRQAGASQMLVASRTRLAWIEEHDDMTSEPTLKDILPTLKCDELDLVLVEGFKREQIPKIELYRQELGYPLIFPDDPNVIAIATNMELSNPVPDLPILDINNTRQIANFIIDRIFQCDIPGNKHEMVLAS